MNDSSLGHRKHDQWLHVAFPIPELNLGDVQVGYLNCRTTYSRPMREVRRREGSKKHPINTMKVRMYCSEYISKWMQHFDSRSILFFLSPLPLVFPILVLLFLLFGFFNSTQFNSIQQSLCYRFPFVSFPFFSAVQITRTRKQRTQASSLVGHSLPYADAKPRILNSYLWEVSPGVAEPPCDDLRWRHRPLAGLSANKWKTQLM
jgi:hypothetical protein